MKFLTLIILFMLAGCGTTPHEAGNALRFGPDSGKPTLVTIGWDMVSIQIDEDQQLAVIFAGDHFGSMSHGYDVAGGDWRTNKVSFMAGGSVYATMRPSGPEPGDRGEYIFTLLDQGVSIPLMVIDSTHPRYRQFSAGAGYGNAF